MEISNIPYEETSYYLKGERDKTAVVAKYV